MRITSCIVDVHDAKADASSRGTSRQPIVTSAPCSHMLLQHELVVHLVDVIAGQEDDELGVCGSR